MSTERVIDLKTGEVTERPLPAPSLDDLKSSKLAEADLFKDALLVAGYHPTHPALAGEALQNRNDEDRLNWNMALDMAKEAVMAGMGAVQQAPFRTASNTTVILTFAEAADVLRAFRQWGVDVLTASWALKDTIAAASDEEALTLISIEEAFAGL